MPRRNSTILISIIIVLILALGFAFGSPNSPFRIGTSNLVFPGVQSGPPIHAVHIEFSDYDLKGSQGAAIDGYLAQANANLISLTAGRVEWTYFKWPDHPEYWSTDVSASGTDFLAADSAHFKKYGKIDAEIDVLSPNYIKAHPAAAAIDASGKTSTDMIGLIELTQGTYGKLLTSMVTYIAANYPDVNSISITEMIYRTDGYGPDEKASYLQFSHQNDWPRNSDGSIAIDDPSIVNWRSQLLANFLGKLAGIAHAHGKQLFLDVSSKVDNQTQFTNESGEQLDTMLQKVDKLVVWCYYYLDGNPPDAMKITALALQKYGAEHIILSIGLWGPNNTVMDATMLQQGIQSAQQGGIPNMWVTPSTLMDGSHWQVLANLWK
ncbi:MAG: hypothetical protein ABSE06_05335 [Anaerolineaceae bacterium]|jgi:hypothetical protein